MSNTTQELWTWARMMQTVMGPFENSKIHYTYTLQAAHYMWNNHTKHIFPFGWNIWHDCSYVGFLGKVSHVWVFIYCNLTFSKLQKCYFRFRYFTLVIYQNTAEVFMVNHNGGRVLKQELHRSSAHWLSRWTSNSVFKFFLLPVKWMRSWP